MAKAKNKNALYIGLALLGAWLAYMLSKGKQNTDTTAPQNEDGNTSGSNTSTSNNTNTNTNTNANTGLNWNLILQVGSRGNEVKKLQSWLMVAQDGIFGPITESALLFGTGLRRGTLTQIQRVYKERGKIVG